MVNQATAAKVVLFDELSINSASGQRGVQTGFTTSTLDGVADPLSDSGLMTDKVSGEGKTGKLERLIHFRPEWFRTLQVSHRLDKKKVSYCAPARFV